MNKKLYSTAAKASLPLLLAAVLLIPTAVADLTTENPVGQGTFFASTADSTPERHVIVSLDPDTSSYDIDNNNISYYTKTDSESSFTKRGVVQADSELDSGAEYALGTTAENTSGYNEWRIETDGTTSRTVTIAGNEHTIEITDVDEFSGADSCEWKLDGNSRTDDEGDLIDVDGDKLWLEDCFTISGDDTMDLVALDAFEFPNDNVDILLTVKNDNDASVVESKRVFYATDGNSNHPGILNISMNGTKLTGLEKPSVTTGSNVRSRVIFPDSQIDTFNVTLRKESDDSVQASNSDGDTDFELNVFGADFKLKIATLNLDAKDDFTSFFAPNNYFNNANTDYDFYIQAENDLTESRRTETLSVSTDGNNEPPEITNVDGDNGTVWKNITNFNDYNETLKEIRVKVEDNNNDFHYGNLSLTASYCGNVYFNKSNQFNADSGTYYWSINDTSMQRVINSGNWTVSVNITDGASYSNQTYNWEIPWANTSNVNYQLKVNGSQGEVDLEQGNVTYWNSSITSSNGNQISATCDNSTHTLDPVAAGNSSSFLAQLSEWIESIGGELL